MYSDSNVCVENWNSRRYEYIFNKIVQEIPDFFKFLFILFLEWV